MDKKQKSLKAASTVPSTQKSAKANTVPNLRRMLYTTTKRNFSIALGVALTVSIAYYYFVKVQRRRRFEEFRRTFDADAAFERMKKKGVFLTLKTDE